MVRRFDKRLVLKSLGVLGIGSVGTLGYYEYKTFSDDFGYNFSSMETDGTHPKPRVLPISTRIKYHILDFATRYKVPLKAHNERFLHKINSSNVEERNEAVHFLANGTQWIDGPDGLPTKERDHVMGRIRRSRIIPGLARLDNFNPSLFLDPPELPENSKLMSDRLLEIFNCLPTSAKIETGNLFTPCVKFFTDAALQELQDIRDWKNKRGEDILGLGTETPIPLKLGVNEDSADLMLLKALRRHADIRSHMASVPTDRLFRLLFRLLSWEADSTSRSLEAREIALRTIANLSLNPRHQAKFIDFGFHKVLREIADAKKFDRTSDEKASSKLSARFQAIRALANLDRDDPNSYRYEDGVFLIHPPYRSSNPPDFDVVFIHGLGGSVSSTWCTDDTEYREKTIQAGKKVNWLDKWVTRDLSRKPGNVRILGIDYETAILFDSHQCPHDLETRTLKERAKSVGEKLIQAGVGDRPTVFVCYSLGGLVLKKILQCYPNLGKSTSGIVFLATPHHGSPAAETTNEEIWTYLASVTKTFVTPEVLFLGGSDEDLEQLNDDFISFVRRNKIKVQSWGEELKSNWGLMIHIVPPEYANPNVGDFFLSKKDHDGMVMPIDEVDPIYSQNLTFIRNCLQK